MDTISQPSSSSSSLSSCSSSSPLDAHVVSLSNGVRIPLLGLGTTHSGGYYHNTVLHALRHGYRMIDTARRYGVERELGIAIRDSGVPREELFVSTKLWPTDFGCGVREACRTALKRLQLDYLDMYMLHFPDVPQWLGCPRIVREDTWRQMELLYDQGIVRSIGVSNFEEADLEELLEYASVTPHANQCEFHPLYDPRALRAYCAENDVLFTGYCPLAKGKALKSPIVEDIAERLGKTPAQVCLRWSVEMGVPVIPKSRDIERVDENAQIFDFCLSVDDRTALSALASPANKIIHHEDLHNKWMLPDGYKLEGRVFGVPSRSQLPPSSSLIKNKTANAPQCSNILQKTF